LLAVASNDVRMRAIQLQLDLGKMQGLGEAAGLAADRAEALLAAASQLFVALLVVTLLVTARTVAYSRTPPWVRAGTVVVVLASVAWMLRQIV